MLPVVASILLTSCDTIKDPPCIDASLSSNKIEITASSLERTCKTYEYSKSPNGSIELLTKTYDHRPSKLDISELAIETTNYSKVINSDTYKVSVQPQINLEQGYHTLNIRACNEINLCSRLELPIYSYGTEMILATKLSEDNNPPKIIGEFFSGKKPICRDCRASDLFGIVLLTLEQDNNSIASLELNSFEQVVDYSKWIKNQKINSEKPFTITASDPRGNKTSLEISFDGYVSRAIGGP